MPVLDSAHDPKFVLLTRPAPLSASLIPAIEALGYRAQLNPLLEIRPLDAALPDTVFDGVICTSQTALHYYAAKTSCKDLPLYVVGRATEEAAHAAGFVNVTMVGESATSLIDFFRRTGLTKAAHLLYPCGQQTTYDLDKCLPQPVTAVPLYDTIFAPLSDETKKLLNSGQIAWIVLFSTRTALALTNAMEMMDHKDWSHKVNLACLSEAVSVPVRAYAWQQIVIAAHPDQDSLLALLASSR